MKVAVINASPRTGWNTAQLVNEAARGARDAGAEVTHFDLYQLDKYTGCIFCFGCKRGDDQGWCVVHDGLYPVLQAIKEADAVIIGTPSIWDSPARDSMRYMKDSFIRIQHTMKKNAAITMQTKGRFS